MLVQIQYKYRCKKSPNSGANKVQIEEHIHKSWQFTWKTEVWNWRDPGARPSKGANKFQIHVKIHSKYRWKYIPNTGANTVYLEDGSLKLEGSRGQARPTLHPLLLLLLLKKSHLIWFLSLNGYIVACTCRKTFLVSLKKKFSPNPWFEQLRLISTLHLRPFWDNFCRSLLYLKLPI